MQTITMIRRFVTITLVCLCLSTTASADTVSIEWTPDGRFGVEKLLHAGKIIEVCGPLAESDRVRWTLKTNDPVDFNLHYHQGEEVVYPQKAEGITESSQEFQALVAQDYCWMISNNQDSNTVLELDLELNWD